MVLASLTLAWLDGNRRDPVEVGASFDDGAEHRPVRAAQSMTSPEGPAGTSRPTKSPVTQATKSAAVPIVVPSRGTGSLRVVPGDDVTQGDGERLTYRVEVEEGLHLEGEQVAATVHTTLTDARGWESLTGIAFERVVDRGADLRVIVATPATTDRLCRPLDTRGELSCRIGDRVVLNAKRWVHAVPDYANARDHYRAYLINHEVGHALGQGHALCEGNDESAPVMMQQTKGARGVPAEPMASRPRELIWTTRKCGDPSAYRARHSFVPPTLLQLT